MLAIERMPYYKNKLFLSSMAVLTGFIMTVGIIRAVNPPDTSVRQSAVTSSDRRASSLIPINASSSETSSESGNKKGDASGSVNSSVNAENSGMASTSTQAQMSTKSTTPAQSSSNTQTGTTSPTTTQSTTQQSSSPKETGGSTTAPVPSCAVTVLTIGLICR